MVKKAIGLSKVSLTSNIEIFTDFSEIISTFIRMRSDIVKCLWKKYVTNEGVEKSLENGS